MTQSHERADSRVATLVVGDSIRVAYEDKSLAGDETVQTYLKALEGPDGDRLTQIMIDAYVGESVAQAVGTESRVPDARVPELGKINMNAVVFKQAMIDQFRAYLDLSLLARIDFRQRLQDASPTGK